VNLTYSNEEIRKILLEHLYIYTADELCQKWGITKYQLRKWKQAFRYTYFIGTVRDMLVVAIHSGATSVKDIQNMLDYLNHCLYSEAEIVEMLEQLQTQGIAINENGLWLYNQDYSNNDASFIF
jgi:transposase-like protein